MNMPASLNLRLPTNGQQSAGYAQKFFKILLTITVCYQLRNRLHILRDMQYCKQQMGGACPNQDSGMVCQILHCQPAPKLT